MKKYSEIIAIIIACCAMIYLFASLFIDYRAAEIVCNETVYRKSYGIIIIDGKRYAICGGVLRTDYDFPVLKGIK